MQISNSKFLKVWKVELDQNGRKKVNLGDSKKNQDGTYSNWTWFFCNLVGNAKGIHIEEGDTITIKSGKIEMYQANDGQWKHAITIFDIEVTAKANQGQGGYSSHQQQGNNSYNNQGNQGGNRFVDDDPNIPF